MGINTSEPLLTVADNLSQYLLQCVSPCLRPQYQSPQLTKYTEQFKVASLFHDPYFGDCYAIQNKQLKTMSILQKETLNEKDYHAHKELLHELSMHNSEDTNDQNIIRTVVIADLDKSGFYHRKRQVYTIHDFIMFDLEKQYQHRLAIKSFFSEEQIKTIIKQCTKGFLRLQLTNYRSVSKNHIYFCSAKGNQIKLAHPKLFNYLTNLQLVLQNYKIKNIYLSPQEMEYLQRNDKNMSVSWASNIFSFGMIILSLMSMNSLNEIYDYRTWQINFQKINDIIKNCYNNYSYSLISLIQQMLHKKQSQRINLRNLYNSVISNAASKPIDPAILNKQDEQKLIKKIILENNNEPKYPNYIAGFMKPKITLAGQYVQTKDDNIDPPFSIDSVIANQRLRYGRQGQYLGEISLADKSNKNSFVRQGKGVYQCSDGQTYIGEWHDGKMQGYGKLYFRKHQVGDEFGNKIRYQGQFKNDLFHGNGVQYAEYQDKNRQNQINDQYIKIYQGNWIKYEGYFINDQRSGAGKIYFRNGYWKGNFKNGQANGEGIYFSYLNNKATAGEWNDGQIVFR